MTDRHRRQVLTLRLPEDVERWLRDHAAATGRAVNAVMVEAMREYRQRHDMED